jgi:solute carrier family 35 protein E3
MGGCVTLGWIVGSIASSTSILMMNKFVMDKYHFSSPSFLTAYHFLVTSGVLELMCRMKLFERAKHMPQLPRWILGFASVGGVVLMNFNLKLNSVGFYQLSKLMCIPTIVLYNFFWLDKRTPWRTMLSLGILLVGISLFTVNDVQVNVLGSITAMFAVGFVTVSQVKTGTVQKEFGINGPAAQHSSAFHQFVMALIAAVFTETHGPNSVLDHEFQRPEVIIIILTGFVSVSVNVCAFGLIGKTSAVTYQVVGHCKTILIFVFGLMLFPANESETRSQFIKKIIGLVIAMSGVIYYTFLELEERARNQPSPSNNGKGDLEILLSDNKMSDEAPLVNGGDDESAK